MISRNQSTQEPQRVKRVTLARAFALAIIWGGIGFAGGFFGPMVLSPEANQGPMLGIFITGPLGFLIGGATGVIQWLLDK